MKVVERPGGGGKVWVAETEDELEAIRYVNTHVPLFLGSELYGLNAYLAALEAKAYKRADPDVLSDQDLMSVTLTVASWMLIRDNLFMDADGQPSGPAMVAVYDAEQATGHAATDQEIIDAQAEDAKLPCHSNTSATHATADLISSELERHGWTE